VKVIRSRKIRWVGHVSRTWETINVYKILAGKLKKRPLGRRGADERIILKCEGVEWIKLAQDKANDGIL
jgi:hypothetical protein